jgi:hypothetical protein
MLTGTFRDKKVGLPMDECRGMKAEVGNQGNSQGLEE